MFYGVYEVKRIKKVRGTKLSLELVQKLNNNRENKGMNQTI
jgi:hypothetical protein